MLKIAICDDEILFTSRLEALLKELARKKGLQINTEIFFDGLTLLKAVEKNQTNYDIIFLDIEMERMDGLETARKLRELDELVFLIYVTNHKNYALEAYEVHPFQFVVKPIDEKLLEKYFLSAYEKISLGAGCYEYKFQKDYFKVPIKDIVYFESDKRKVNIHLADGTVRAYYDRLNAIEEQMRRRKADFWRIHRSLLVNGRYIRQKAYNRVVLFDGTELFISEDRRKAMNEQYARSVEEEML